MSKREASLEAPLRQPLSWRDPGYSDEGALYGEMERAFDICHGCRRCVLTPDPSSTLMFKQEQPPLLPADEQVRGVSEAMFDPFEYFMLRRRDDLLKKDCRIGLGKVSYHIPCHGKGQNGGRLTRDPGDGSLRRGEDGGTLRGSRRHLGARWRILPSPCESDGRSFARWGKAGRSTAVPTAPLPAAMSSREWGKPVQKLKGPSPHPAAQGLRPVT